MRFRESSSVNLLLDLDNLNKKIHNLEICKILLKDNILEIIFKSESDKLYSFLKISDYDFRSNKDCLFISLDEEYEKFYTHKFKVKQIYLRDKYINDHNHLHLTYENYFFSISFQDQECDILDFSFNYSLDLRRNIKPNIRYTFISYFESE